MRVLGIDPGYDRLGLAIVEGDPSRPSYVWSDCFIPTKGFPEERLAQIYEVVEHTISTYNPERIAVETLYFSTNKKTALAVAQARGVVLAVCGNYKLPVLECTPAQVKLSVTGYGSADKKAIASMVPKLIILPVRTRLDDELDAIAVAITGLSGSVV
jgi:crossover junction endodeoxyribonuclease RuvC